MTLADQLVIPNLIFPPIHLYLISTLIIVISNFNFSINYINNLLQNTLKQYIRFGL